MYGVISGIVILTLVIAIGVAMYLFYSKPDSKSRRRERKIVNYRRTGLETGIQIAGLSIIGLTFASGVFEYQVSSTTASIPSILFGLATLWVPITSLALPRKRGWNIAANIISVIVIGLFVFGFILALSTVDR